MSLKICGIRDQQMLNSCIENNISYVGLNFVPTSRRKVPVNFSPEVLSSESETKLVGVFQNASLEKVKEIAIKYHLDIVQLHGDENLDYAKSLDFPVMKAFALKDSDSLKNIAEFCGHVAIILLDGAAPGSGGLAKDSLLLQGITICREQKQPFAIAGGINAENLKFFSTNYPDSAFFDTASGVEDSDGSFSVEILNTLLTQTK